MFLMHFVVFSVSIILPEQNDFVDNKEQNLICHKHSIFQINFLTKKKNLLLFGLMGLLKKLFD